jgi:hypothetical protein
MKLYTGPWAYSEYDKSVPASVRLRNIGAIGSSRDNHEARFGAPSRLLMVPIYLLQRSPRSTVVLPTMAITSSDVLRCNPASQLLPLL